MNTPKTSIIITNWNRWTDVEVVLRLLLRKSEQFLEVIVVDNGSDTKPTFDWESLAKTKFIFLEKNFGPCVARNVGANQAKGKYLLFLDSDALLSRRAIAHLEKRFESEKDLGVVGFRVEHKFERKLDQWIYAQEKSRKKQSFDTYSFSACAAMAPKSVYLQIGGFNEKMFMYNEEVDLSYRVILNGYRVGYDSGAVVYHFPASSGRVISKNLWKLMIKHWIVIFFSYYPTVEAYRRAFARCVLYIMKGIYLGVLPAILSGIYKGFSEVRAVSKASKKLTPEKIRYIDSLNRRKKIIWGRS